MPKTRGARRSDYYRALGADFCAALGECVELAGGQSALARASGVPQQRISGLLSGQNVEMSPATVVKLRRGIVRALAQAGIASGEITRLRVEFDQTVQPPVAAPQGLPEVPALHKMTRRGRAAVKPIEDYIGAKGGASLERGKIQDVKQWPPTMEWVTVTPAQLDCLVAQEQNWIAVEDWSLLSRLHERYSSARVSRDDRVPVLFLGPPPQPLDVPTARSRTAPNAPSRVKRSTAPR